ncbi:hypothetical protein ACEPAG_2162 [Sanghuangporus baumii]
MVLVNHADLSAPLSAWELACHLKVMLQSLTTSRATSAPMIEDAVFAVALPNK